MGRVSFCDAVGSRGLKRETAFVSCADGAIFSVLYGPSFSLRLPLYSQSIFDYLGFSPSFAISEFCPLFLLCFLFLLFYSVSPFSLSPIPLFRVLDLTLFRSFSYPPFDAPCFPLFFCFLSRLLLLFPPQTPNTGLLIFAFVALIFNVPPSSSPLVASRLETLNFACFRP